jgi:hypothetical protein
VSSRIELTEAGSVQEIEDRQKRQRLEADPTDTRPTFGKRQAEWDEFKAKSKPSDECFAFKDKYSRACGYVLMRNDRPIEWFIVGATL